MDNPIKIIHKFKNNNRRIQYMTYIFVGSLIDDDIVNILESFKDKTFNETLINLSKNRINILEEKYGEYWYTYFFNKYHVKKEINSTIKNLNKKNLIKNKLGDEWFNKHFNTFKLKKTEYSFASNYYDYLVLRNKIKTKVKKTEMDFTTYKKNRQFGGSLVDDMIEENKSNEEYVTNENIDDKIDEENDDTPKTEEDLDDTIVDNFNLDELTKFYSMDTIESDKNIKETAKLISEATNDKQWVKDSKEAEGVFNNKLDDLPYDNKIEDVYEKVFIYEQYIFMDDNITTLRNKIAVSIPLSEKYGDKFKLLPEYQYFWSEYNLDNNIESVMIGQKWIRRNELLKVDIQPNENIDVYEKLKGNLSYLKESLGVKLKRDDDENLILRDYENYISYNEIYMVDIINELGLNYNSQADGKKNLYEVYFNIYFPFINFKRMEDIIDLMNGVNSIELDKNNNTYSILNNDVRLEKEIYEIIEETKLDNNRYKNLFEENYVLQSIIHVNLNDDDNLTGTITNEKYDLYKIFDSFIVNDEYPFIQYQTPDTQITYKFYENSETINDKDILSKWFETSPYGISFKIKVSDDKYISINLNENGRLEYKVTFREIDKIIIEKIKNSYKYVNNLLLKINSENQKIKFVIPEESKYKYAFINTILKFNLINKYKIDHNDLSDFCRFFYTYIALVIEPKKRLSSSGKENEFSKFGTYLRYKRVSNYENKTRMHLRMLYFLRNFEISDLELIDEIAKQFNITKENAAYELDQVKAKYGTILSKISKKLQKIKNLPKSKPPGIGIDIQGRSSDNYKIRITGARSKIQLDEIIDFLKVLIYLYIETYIHKKPKFQKIKDVLLKLNKVAKRRNKVNNIVDYESEIKEIKVITSIDKKRLGFRPDEGMNQWSRNCQNSGKQRRQPIVVKEEDINKLIKKGYKLNPKTKMYEKEVIIDEKGVKKKVTVKAVKLPTDDNKFIYYTCNPDENNEYIHVGFLSKSNNPNELCMPCCFKKDQMNSDNLKKKNYYMKCTGDQKADNNIEKEEIKSISDKIYVLQDTNKVQEGRFIFLSKHLNKFFNSIYKNDFKIKNHYLIETNSGYFLKFTVKDKYYNFLATLSNIFDLSIDDIKNKCVDYLNNDKLNTFTWLNNGDIKSMFKTKEKYINHIKKSNYLEYDLVGELVSLPNVISKNGYNIFIFNKKVKIIKKEFEKDKYVENFYIDCLNIENKIDTNKDFIILIKEGKYLFPIYWVQKKKNDKKMTLIKKFNNEFNKVYDDILNYYSKSCYNDIFKNINSLSNITAKNIQSIINNTKNIKIIEQFLDERNKIKYLYCDIDGIKQLIPTKPSGSLLGIKINTINEISNKYINNIDITIKSINKFNKYIDLDYIPNTIFYNKKTKSDKPKYNITSLLLKNKLIVMIRNIEMQAIQFKKYGLSYEQQSLSELVDKEINDKNIIIDDVSVRTSERVYRNEGYNLFRLELSYYINKYSDIKKKIIDIVRSKLNTNIKKKELIDVINKILKNKMKDSNNNIINYFEIINKLPNIQNYRVINIRQYCHLLNKDDCEKNIHCHTPKDKKDKCRFSIYSEYLTEYYEKILLEMLQDKIKFKEIIQEDDYYVSDIVDYTQYSNRPDQKIIKTTNFNIKQILEELFGKDNIPILGRRRKMNTNTDIDLDYPNMIELNDRFIQEIINNKDTIIRAFVNSYFWINNPLYDNNSRNIGYFSDLQTKITNLFKANLIDYMLNNTFNKELINDLDGLIELKDMSSTKNFFISSINRFKKNIINTTGIVELIVLSYLFNYPIIVYDNFENIKYIFSNGQVKVNEKTINKYLSLKDKIVLKFDFEGGNKVPSTVYSIYLK